MPDYDARSSLYYDEEELIDPDWPAAEPLALHHFPDRIFMSSNFVNAPQLHQEFNNLQMLEPPVHSIE